MKRVLVLNFGSSSLKWSLLDAGNEAVIQQGEKPRLHPGEKESLGKIQALFKQIPVPDAVGHRLVHGGGLFHKTTLVDTDVRNQLETLVDLDPLHMRPALEGLDALMEQWPLIPQYASFDTAFHSNLPLSTGYALPHQWIHQWNLKRFGFHGLSAAYAVKQSELLLGKIPERMVVCHLGSGSSVTAIRDGLPVDTTMGFTPLEGLTMATRSGSVDPGLLLYLQIKKGISAAELQKTLTLKSGLLGVSDISGDIREVLKAVNDGHPSAILAYNQFIHSAKKAIGAMTAVLGGVNAVVFTGGIGENNSQVRGDLISAFAFNGTAINRKANQDGTEDRDISLPFTLVKILVIRSREDLTILREILQQPH
jgi:acetate kinase